MSAQGLYKWIIDSHILIFPFINTNDDSFGEKEHALIMKDFHTPPQAKRHAVLYVHIPFCNTRCTYCVYNSLVAREGDPRIEQYLAVLHKEIDHFREMAYTREVIFDAIFIGGGTPSQMSTRQMDTLLQKIMKSFTLAPSAEVTIEFNLQTMIEDKIAVCKNNGVTRISFGWQTFAPYVRKISALIPTEEDLINKTKLLKKYHYNINTDLMYGMPQQTFDDWKEDIRKAMEFEFTGIDLFKCELVPAAPLYHVVKKNNWTLPDKEMNRDMNNYAVQELKSNGYIMNTYHQLYHPREEHAKAIYTRVTNLSSHDILAIGTGCFGVFADWAYYTGKNVDEYIRWGNEQTDSFFFDCVFKMNKGHWLERDFVLGLPRAFSLPKNLVSDQLDERYQEVIDKLKFHGLLKENASEYALTDEANGYVFNISHEFFSDESKRRIGAYITPLMKSQKEKKEQETAVAAQKTDNFFEFFE